MITNGVNILLHDCVALYLYFLHPDFSFSCQQIKTCSACKIVTCCLIQIWDFGLCSSE